MPGYCHFCFVFLLCAFVRPAQYIGTGMQHVKAQGVLQSAANFSITMLAGGKHTAINEDAAPYKKRKTLKPNLSSRQCLQTLSHQGRDNRSVPAPPGIATRRNAESVGADDHIGPKRHRIVRANVVIGPYAPLFSVILSERSESKDPPNIATLQGILRLRLRLRSE